MTTPDEKEAEVANIDTEALKDLRQTLHKSDSILRLGIGRDTFTGNDLEKYVTKSLAERKAKKRFP